MTYTKEQLIEEAEGNITMLRASLEYVKDPFERDDISTDLRLAEIALAALTAEPVAWIIEGGKNNTPCHLSSHKEYVEAYPDRDVTPLYTAPPALVVPETLPCPVMLEPGLRFGKGVRTQTMLDALQRRAEYSAELEAMTPEQRTDHDARMKEFAAILQGAAGNSPAIPDGWVACSERMPAKGQEVLCTDQFENYETALYDTGYIPGPPFFATTAGEFHPTHWMPLPAAPQQEVK